MRAGAPLWLVLALAAPATVAAQDVLWLGDEGEELSTALELELAARSLSLGRGPSPRGGTAEAAHRRAALECELRGARVALFASDGSVHAVSDAGAPREATLPSEEPRLVAIVAASLVDEALDAAPEPAASRTIRAARAAPTRPPSPPPPIGLPEAPEEDARGAAPYGLVRTGLVVFHQGSLGLPHATLEAGVSVNRTWRAGVQAVGPVSAPLRERAQPGEYTPEPGTPGFGGGIAVSIRGAVDELELRAGAELAMLGRQSGEAVIAERSGDAGVLAGLRGALGIRAMRSMALLFGATLGVLMWSGSEPLAMFSFHAGLELF